MASQLKEADTQPRVGIPEDPDIALANNNAQPACSVVGARFELGLEDFLDPLDLRHHLGAETGNAFSYLRCTWRYRPRRNWNW